MSGFICAEGVSYVLDMIGGGEFPVSDYYVALTNTVATQFNTGDELDEINAAEYARAQYQNVSGAWLLAGQNLSNHFEIDFPVASSDWGVVKGWALTDQPTGGRLLWAGSLTPTSITASMQPIYAPGALSVGIPLTSWLLNA